MQPATLNMDDLTVGRIFGLEDRPRKMTTEQLNDFVQAVADLKSGGIHQKSGHYKNAWVQIAQMLKDKHNAEYSVEYLRSQWHLRLKVTRRRFYAVTENLTEQGLPITEENVDNEMLKENALCKPCDRIIYLHFRKMWLDQRQIKSEHDLSVPEARLPSPEDEIDSSFFANYSFGLDAINMSESIKLLLNTFPAETLTSLIKAEPDTVEQIMNEQQQEELMEPEIKKGRIEAEVEVVPEVEQKELPQVETFASIAESLKTIATTTSRFATALEGIHSLLIKIVPQ